MKMVRLSKLHLNVSKQRIMYLIYTGRIPAEKRGSVWYVDEDSIAKYTARDNNWRKCASGKAVKENYSNLLPKGWVWLFEYGDKNTNALVRQAFYFGWVNGKVMTLPCGRKYIAVEKESADMYMKTKKTRKKKEVYDV